MLRGQRSLDIRQKPSKEGRGESDRNGHHAAGLSRLSRQWTWLSSRNAPHRNWGHPVRNTDVHQCRVPIREQNRRSKRQRSIANLWGNRKDKCRSGQQAQHNQTESTDELSPSSRQLECQSEITSLALP